MLWILGTLQKGKIRAIPWRKIFYRGNRAQAAGVQAVRAHKLANGERCALSRVLSSMRCTKSRVDP